MAAGISKSDEVTPVPADSMRSDAATSAWAPLRRPVFRALWVATMVSNIGSWMHEIGAAWLMTTLSSNPLMIALVQAAATLPVFLLAIPAGVFADLIDRRRFLLAAQLWILLTSLSLSILALFGLVTPTVLLVATFALGIGSALHGPPFIAIVAELVPRAELPAAVALNAIGMNLARAIGPAVGGVVIALVGPPAVFLLNSLSVVCVSWVVWRWRRQTEAGVLPPEHFLSAMHAGLRYVRYAPLLRATLIRATAFLLPASAVWALLPLIARNQLELSASGYGVLLACLGVGAVAGALILPRARTAGIGSDAVLLAATCIFSAAAMALGLVSDVFVAGVALVLAGTAWMLAISTLNSAAQITSSGWVKARSLAVYLVFFAGSMTVGSVFWGQTAAWFGISAALGAAASLGAVLGLGAVFKAPLRAVHQLDLAPARHLRDEASVDDTEHDRGPVMITVTYRVSLADKVAFVTAVRDLRRVRLRAGALTWGVYEDHRDAGHWVEVYIVESWLGHLRQDERMTINDERLLARAFAFHRGPDSVQVAHLIAPPPAFGHKLAADGAKGMLSPC